MGIIEFIFSTIFGIIGLVLGIIGAVIGLVVGLIGTVFGLIVVGIVILILLSPLILLWIIFF